MVERAKQARAEDVARAIVEKPIRWRSKSVPELATVVHAATIGNRAGDNSATKKPKILVRILWGSSSKRVKARKTMGERVKQARDLNISLQLQFQLPITVTMYIQYILVCLKLLRYSN